MVHHFSSLINSFRKKLKRKNGNPLLGWIKNFPTPIYNCIFIIYLYYYLSLFIPLCYYLLMFIIYLSLLHFLNLFFPIICNYFSIIVSATSKDLKWKVFFSITILTILYSSFYKFCWMQFPFLLLVDSISFLQLL